MKKLLEELEKNPEMKAKIKELDQNPKSVPQDYIKAASKYGVELTEEDFQPANGQGEKTCACVCGGGGEFTGGAIGITGIKARCACVATGFGQGY